MHLDIKINTCLSCDNIFHPVKTHPNQKYCSIKCQRKEARKRNADKIKKYLEKYRIDSAELIKEKNKEYRINNKDKINKYSKSHYYKNKKNKREYHNNYRRNKRQRALAAASTCRRREYVKIATPKWANQEYIKLFYLLAKVEEQRTGKKVHVDHIIPLQSNIVCGLHCEDNLQHLFQKENLKKNNSLIEAAGL